MEAEFITVLSNVITVLIAGLVVSIVDPYVVERKKPQPILTL